MEVDVETDPTLCLRSCSLHLLGAFIPLHKQLFFTHTQAVFCSVLTANFCMSASKQTSILSHLRHTENSLFLYLPCLLVSIFSECVCFEHSKELCQGSRSWRKYSEHTTALLKANKMASFLLIKRAAIYGRCRKSGLIVKFSCSFHFRFGLCSLLTVTSSSCLVETCQVQGLSPNVPKSKIYTMVLC